MSIHLWDGSSLELAALLVHVADHVQRHVGQAVTTSKIVLAQRR